MLASVACGQSLSSLAFLVLFTLTVRASTADKSARTSPSSSASAMSLALKLFTQILRKEKAALNAVSAPFKTD